MNSLHSEYDAKNRNTISRFPQIVSLNGFEAVLFGEDPGSIIDEIDNPDQIEKLTR